MSTKYIIEGSFFYTMFPKFWISTELEVFFLWKRAGNRFVISCLKWVTIGDPLETDMSPWRSIGTDIPYRWHACLIGDPLDMLVLAWRSSMGLLTGMLVSEQAWRTRPSIRHVGLRSGTSVSDQTRLSPIRHVCLQSDTFVSNQTCRSLMGLR